MGGGRVSGERGWEKVGAEWAEETTVVGLGGVAGAGGVGEGLEHARVGGRGRGRGARRPAVWSRAKQTAAVR